MLALKVFQPQPREAMLQMVDHGPSGDASASVISWSPDQEILVCVMLMLKHILSCPELLPDGMVSPIPVTLDVLFVLKNM